MAPSIGHPDDSTRLLRFGYDVPPLDHAFTSQLLHRLEAEMGATPGQLASGSEKGRIALSRTKAWWRYGAIAAAAGVIIITVALVIRVSTDRVGVAPQAAQRPGAPAKVVTAGNPAPPRVPEAGPGITLGYLSLEDQIGRVPLIVRAKAIGWRDGIVEFAVSHVVYGTGGDKSIKLDMSTEIGFARERARDKMITEGIKEPTEPDLTERALVESGVVKGKDLIIFLMPFARHPAADKGVKHLSYGMSFDVPPKFSLNDHEKEIIQAIAKGKYLEPRPQPSDVLAERMRQATLIVRATLTQIGDDGATWKIIRTVQGRADKDTIIVDFDLFRLRAEAIVNYELRAGESAPKPASRPTKEEVEARVEPQAKRLIRAELVPGREAVLFLDECKPQDDGVHARLRHRLYGDQQSQNLDELEKAIASPSRSINL